MERDLSFPVVLIISSNNNDNIQSMERETIDVAAYS